MLECFLTSFDFSYTNNNQYGFGRMRVSVQGVGPGTVLCAVTLRDNNTNYRQWQGTVTCMAVACQGSSNETPADGGR